MRGQYWSDLSCSDGVAVSVEGEHDEAAVAAEADQHRHQNTVQPQRGHHLGLLPKNNIVFNLIAVSFRNQIDKVLIPLSSKHAYLFLLLVTQTNSSHYSPYHY